MEKPCEVQEEENTTGVLRCSSRNLHTQIFSFESKPDEDTQKPKRVKLTRLFFFAKHEHGVITPVGCVYSQRGSKNKCEIAEVVFRC